MMKKIIVSVMCALLPLITWSMEIKNNVPVIGQKISADDKVEPLKRNPEINSMVLIGYNNQYHWGLVRAKVGKEFSIIDRQEGHIGHGVLLPLERLYMLAQNEKNNEENSL